MPVPAPTPQPTTLSGGGIAGIVIAAFVVLVAAAVVTRKESQRILVQAEPEPPLTPQEDRGGNMRRPIMARARSASKRLIGRGAAEAPSNDALLRACAHPGVTVAKLRSLGTDEELKAAAREKAKQDNSETERKENGKIVEGARALHCICMNESVTIETLREVHELWKDAAKQKTAVRLGSLRAQMSSRRVTTLSIASSTERIHASALHLHEPEGDARDAERGG